MLSDRVARSRRFATSRYNSRDQLWDEKRFEIVVNGNREKFQQNAELKTMLLETVGREIIEASAMDKIWGIGFSQVNAMKNKRRWGQNLLGKALMQVRDELLVIG